MSKRSSNSKINYFYQSRAWHLTRNAYMRSVSGLCEQCLAEGKLTPAVFVHHKVWLTPDNVGNADVSLSFDNLQALCAEHHAAIHKKEKLRYKILPNGNLLTPP